jgi:glycosyltransferase involved in cell wall biosynthesis
VDRRANANIIGIVVPLDYMSIQGGLAQRVKADLAALMHGGYTVEVIYPPHAKRLQHGLPPTQTVVAYSSMNNFKLLSEKNGLLVDMCTQMFNPFFHSILRKRSIEYSVILAHSPWSAAAAYKVVKDRKPILYVAHNFEYGLMEQTDRNFFIRKLVHRIEKHACQKATKILCASEHDIKAFETVYKIPKARLALSPNTVDVDSLSQTHTVYNKESERRKLGIDSSSLLLLFPGRMDYAPNLDALRFIIHELVPALRNDGSAIKLAIAGAQIPKWCFHNSNEIISFYSDVPDMRRFLSAADAVIVPLRFGSGTRLKILESFAAGVPVVSTDKGAEGIDCRDGSHILIARNNAHDLINKIKLLAANQILRQRLIDNAYNLVVQRYSISQASICLAEAITQAQGREG